MKILQNYDLTKLNTFGIAVKAQFFAELHNEAELEELFNSPEFRNNQKIFLGGGSNVLFTKDFNGIVILNKLKGIEILAENDKTVTIRAMGGEIWHDLVTFAVNREYWGIENLSLIPGTVGAAPIQNIGAYGAELADVLANVEAYGLENKENEKKVFSKVECRLGYRDSIFKNELRGKYFISAVTITLSKLENKNITYKILEEYLKENKIKVKNPKTISEAVTNIRRSKLPNPAVAGNAGSFFKNVLTDKMQIEELLKTYPEMPYFLEDELVKIPAGWLIEQAGWKGKGLGNVGVHEKQALVLVNYGGASGEEILNLANKIIESVKEKFNLELTPEVNIV
jgi:UDP-N-acetylmuramate dehydrogenase